ncbi:hypothetical protein FOBRF1_001008 [Fusarium oxysporum]
MCRYRAGLLIVARHCRFILNRERVIQDSAHKLCISATLLRHCYRSDLEFSDNLSQARWQSPRIASPIASLSDELFDRWVVSLFRLVALFLSWTTPGFVDYQSWRVNDMLNCNLNQTSGQWSAHDR